MDDTIHTIIDYILDRKNAIRILVQLQKGPMRFNELHRVFGSPVTLTLRLRELEDLNLVTRKMEIDKGNSDKRNPAVVYYTLTETGKEVASVCVGFLNNIRKKLGKQLQKGPKSKEQLYLLS